MNPHTLQTEFTRVKPLVWDAFGKECVRAETVLGRYEIMWGFHNGQTSLDIPAPRRTHVWHPTLEAATAAAQADYEARILAALEPVTERDNARALLALCLPYIEDCAGDPAYKGAPVADLVRKMREAVK